MEITNIDTTVEKALDLVYSSARPMPAHFTSEGDRKQTFLVDFGPLTAEADYELASESWYATDKFFTLETCSTRQENDLAILCGEDVILGSFIVTKLGKPESTGIVRKIIIDSAIKKLYKLSDDIKAFFEKPEIVSYINYCEKRGQEIAETF